MSALVVGATFVATRTFTTEMVEAFTVVSRDAGRHHVAPDATGRLWVHGLLVASLATEIGGGIDYLARTIDFEFLRPVLTGDTITCTVRIDKVDANDRRTRLELSGEAVNAGGETVMRVTSTGVVLAG